MVSKSQAFWTSPALPLFLMRLDRHKVVGLWRSYLAIISHSLIFGNGGSSTTSKQPDPRSVVIDISKPIGILLFFFI